MNALNANQGTYAQLTTSTSCHAQQATIVQVVYPQLMILLVVLAQVARSAQHPVLKGLSVLLVVLYPQLVLLDGTKALQPARHVCNALQVSIAN